MPEGGEALFQPQSVGRADGEDSNAALRAAGTAQEVRPAAFRGIGKGAIDQRNKSAVLALEMCLGMIRVGYGIGAHGSIVGQMLWACGCSAICADFDGNRSLLRDQRGAGKANGAFAGRRLRGCRANQKEPATLLAVFETFRAKVSACEATSSATSRARE